MLNFQIHWALEMYGTTGSMVAPAPDLLEENGQVFACQESFQLPFMTPNSLRTVHDNAVDPKYHEHNQLWGAWANL
jgi:hypothetical protein